MADDIQQVRNEWLQEGIVPRCNVRGFCEFNSISRTLSEGECTVKQCPLYYEDIEEFMIKMGVPYKGQGIGIATLNVIEHLMAPKRQPPSPAEKQALLIKQKYQCANCGTSLINVAAEVDHEPRIAESHNTETRVLCVPCHRTKSSEEQSRGNRFSIQSRFSPHAAEFFRNQAPTPPLVLHISDSAGKGSDHVWQCDIVKCRAECWKYSSSDFSISAAWTP